MTIIMTITINIIVLHSGSSFGLTLDFCNANISQITRETPDESQYGDCTNPGEDKTSILIASENLILIYHSHKAM